MNSLETRALVLTVRLLDGRFHGEPEWPPSPARLFQALIAGAATSRALSVEDITALEWLETLAPPTIAAPRARLGEAVKYFVPNNDLDAEGGDPAAIANIRTSKNVQPRLFDSSTPFIYVWTLTSSDEEVSAIHICEQALRLYQLGRGLDPASASGAILDASALAELLDAYPGAVHRPSLGGVGDAPQLLCPQRGSLTSLVARYEATLGRFQTEGKGSSKIQVFQQPPKARFTQVAYDGRAARALFEIRPLGDMGAFSSTPQTQVVALAEALRDGAAGRLIAALPAKARDVERALVGRPVEGMDRLPSELRVGIVPLPSIGSEHVDRGVRRVMVEVPSGGLLRAEDVFWAFSGLELTTPSGANAIVTRADDHKMLSHYGVDGDEGLRRWQSVSPVALPASRRRIEPTRQDTEAKAAAERVQEEESAYRAVRQALRHAGVHAQVASVQVQREPFAAKGTRAEDFAQGTRFPKERLWHLDVTFREPVRGPMILGDGRFLGLGIMAPVNEVPSVLAYQVLGGLLENASPLIIADAARRAVMARFQQRIGDKRTLPSFVSGHEPNGEPLRTKPHLTFSFDPTNRCVLIVAPHAFSQRRPKKPEVANLRTLVEAMAGFSELRAGSAGRLELTSVHLELDSSSLVAPSAVWESRTPFTVNRHVDAANAKVALATDLEQSLREAGLPSAEIVVHKAWSEPGVGLTGRAEVRFDVAVPGPIILGRTRFRGGGLFGHGGAGADG